jgi:hypothetical protein
MILYESVRADHLQQLVKLFNLEFNKKFRLGLEPGEVENFCEGLISHPYTPKRLFGSYSLPASPSKLKELFPVYSEKELEKINRFVQSSTFFTERLKFMFGTQLAINLALNKGVEIPDEVKDDIDIAKHSPLFKQDYEDIAWLLRDLKQQDTGYFIPKKEVLDKLFRQKNKAKFRKMPNSNIYLDYDFVAAVTVYLFDLVSGAESKSTKDICNSIKKVIDRAIKIEARVNIHLPLKTYTSQLSIFTSDDAEILLTDERLPLFSVH